MSRELEKIQGLHHFTAIAGEPTENAKFYVNILGLRMVKKTVNHDAPQMYHLFYGDREGTPGSSITFFPGMSDQEAKPGKNMVTELGLRIPEDSISYWRERLEEKDVELEEDEWHGSSTLKFKDDSSLQLRLVEQESEDFKAWKESPVPEEFQLRGMHHVTLSVAEKENMERLLEEMGLEKEDDSLYRAEDGSAVKLEQSEDRGVMGRGSVHHVAFKAGDEENQERWRDKIQEMGMRPSPAISRKYFTSFYFRTSPGILFEFSTMGPGYTADESVEELGSSLVLPEKLESRREQIEKILPEFNEEEIR